MKKNRARMITCERCKNSYFEGKLCDYCVWKGWEGPGKKLKEIIRTENKR